jgi:putative redox protein
MTASAERKLAASAHARCEAKYGVETAVRRHRVVSDEPTERGGGDTGASPLELLATALASCTAITLRMYAERKRWELGTVTVDCRVLVEGKTYQVERSIRFGADVADEHRARLAEIAEKTPVTRIVKEGVTLATVIH